MSLRQLVAAGHDRRQVARWALEGLLERVARGWYRLAGPPITGLGRLHLAQRLVPGGLISGEAMLAAAGVAGVAVPECVLVLHDSHLRRVHPTVRLERVPLHRVCRELHRGYATSDGSWALAEVARDPDVPDATLRILVDNLRYVRWFPVASYGERWRRMLHHPGADRMLGLLPDLELESEGERWAWRELFLPHPPLPDRQVWVLPHRRADFAYLAAGLIPEYRGAAAHDGRADEDAARTLDIEEPGLREVPVTASLVRRPARTMAHIHRLRIERERLVAEGRLTLPPLPPQTPRVTPLRTLRPDK